MVRIDYIDEPISANTNFIPSVSLGGVANVANMSLIHDRTKKLLPYSNPCEQYAVALNNEALPYEPYGEIALWSQNISDANGEFSAPIKLVLTAGDLYSTTGITLEFDTINNMYSTDLEIIWYRDDEELQSQKFYPDKPKYYCENNVNDFNKLEIVFNKTNIGLNRLRLNAVYYGVVKEFSGRDLTNVKIVQQVSPITAETYIGTSSIGARITDGVKYSFTNGQMLAIYLDNELLSTQFISEAKRQSKTDWDLKTEDYLGILADTTFAGGVVENVEAYPALQEIFDTANVPYDIDPIFKNMRFTGFIPYTNCREALRQAVFAIQGIVICDNRKIYIKPSPINGGNPDLIKISKSRIMQGGTLEQDVLPSAIEITFHKYEKSGTEEEIFKADAADEGEVLIVFSDPYYDIDSNWKAQKVEITSTYAKITAPEAGFVITGKKYKHIQQIKRKTYPTSRDINTGNVISIPNMTLINANNIDNVLNMCYNYYANPDALKTKIIERKHDDGTKDRSINLYDEIQCDTVYSGDFVGIVTKQTFNLNSSIVVKETEVKGVNYGI